MNYDGYAKFSRFPNRCGQCDAPFHLEGDRDDHQAVCEHGGPGAERDALGSPVWQLEAVAGRLAWYPAPTITNAALSRCNIDEVPADD